MTITPRLELRQSQSLVMTPRCSSRSDAADVEPRARRARRGHRRGQSAARGGTPSRAPDPRAPGFARGAAEGPSAIDLAPRPSRWPIISHQVRLARAGRRRSRRPRVARSSTGRLSPGAAAEVAERHGLSRAALDAGSRSCRNASRPGSARATSPSAFRCSSATAGELDPPMSALLDGLDLLAAGPAAELAARCGVDVAAGDSLLACCGASIRSPAPASPRRRWRSWCPTSSCGAVARAGTSSSTPRRCRACSSTTSTPSKLGTATAPRSPTSPNAGRRRTGSCAAWSSGPARSSRWRARIVAHQERFFAAGSRGMRPLSQRMLAEKLGLHEST
jgi:hypothetical protein